LLVGWGLDLRWIKTPVIPYSLSGWPNAMFAEHPLDVERVDRNKQDDRERGG